MKYALKNMEKDISTEIRIKEAARKVFLEKGYGQSRTRDIAEEAGINLALLNYYFRSKEKLFDIIMEESLHQILSIITDLINDRNTTLSHKIDKIVENYINALNTNPNLALFVLSEIQVNSENLMKKIGIPPKVISSSFFYKQISEQLNKNNLHFSPLHIIINIISMCVFPIVAKPLLLNMDNINDENYTNIINERKLLIPIWIKEILKLNE